MPQIRTLLRASSPSPFPLPTTAAMASFRTALLRGPSCSRVMAVPRRLASHTVCGRCLSTTVPIAPATAWTLAATAAAAAAVGGGAGLCGVQWWTRTTASALMEAGERYRRAVLATSTSRRSSWRRVARAAWRLAYLTVVAAPYLVALPVAHLLRRLAPGRQQWVWTSLVETVEASGPTFIKLAQWAATREDLFPAQLTAQFARLQDRNRPHPWAATERILERDLGPRWREFLDLEQQPVGSGCIAQVHKGLLRASALRTARGDCLPWLGTARPGKDVSVAVKVLHPGMLDIVEADLDLLRWAADAVELIPRLEYLSMRGLVDEFRRILLEQLDMRIEARNLAKLREDFKDDKDVTFPEPYMSSHDILVEKFIVGEPIRHFLKSDRDTRLKLSDLGMHTVFKMVFINNFVHADLHPGNLLVTLGDDKKNPKLVILDAGMAVELKPSSHKNMVDILLAFFRSEGYRAGELMVEGSRNKCSDIDAFCRDVEGLVIRSHQSPFFDKFGSYVAEVCAMACAHQVKLNEQFVTMAMAIKVLEGIVLSLNPDVELCQAAIPILLKAQVKHSMGMFLNRTKTKTRDGGSSGGGSSAGPGSDCEASNEVVSQP